MNGPESRRILPFLPPTLPHRCRFLPLLPPITPNVKLAIPANPLEFGIRAEAAPDTKSKSGKNGNVDHPSQHRHLGLPLAFMPGSRRPGLSPASMSRRVHHHPPPHSAPRPRRRTSRPTAIQARLQSPAGRVGPDGTISPYPGATKPARGRRDSGRIYAAKAPRALGNV